MLIYGFLFKLTMKDFKIYAYLIHRYSYYFLFEDQQYSFHNDVS